jgi:RNA polymerase sigma-70 factor (ECF subfamily)
MHDDDADLHRQADFDETFREHYWPMVRSLAVACGDREAAADAVQDAFTRAYVRWRRISRYDHPAGWIRHVALNRLRDHFRHEARGEKVRERLQGDAAITEAAPELADEGLAAAIAGLPQQQRIAVSLFYVEQLSVREIAASMKLSDGAVKYHLHAGRASLREWVEAETAAETGDETGNDGASHGAHER